MASFRTVGQIRHFHKSGFINRKKLSRIFHGTGQVIHESDKVGCRSQRLMVSLGLIRSGAAGTYSLLPLANRAVEKLLRIIDGEMQAMGAEKISMPTLGGADMWRSTGRWESMGSELFRLRDRHGADLCLSPTHEEAVTSILSAESPISYKRLPIRLYQITRKFRDERRPKHGLLRGREFDMKDLYTFDQDEEGAQAAYRDVTAAYQAILNKLNLSYITVAGSTGAMGGSMSHEYHLPCDIGEDTLYTCSRCGKSFNKEIVDDASSSYCDQGDCSNMFSEVQGIEVMHTFILGDRYSSALKALYSAPNGKRRPLYMGCYGLGVTRLLAASIEVLSTSDHIRWPALLSPYTVCVIPQKEGYKADITYRLSEEVYDKLSGIPSLRGEVVLDDRISQSIGKRLQHTSSLGFPWAIILGKKALEEQPLYELVDVYAGTSEYLSIDQLMRRMMDVHSVTL